MARETPPDTRSQRGDEPDVRFRIGRACPARPTHFGQSTPVSTPGPHAVYAAASNGQTITVVEDAPVKYRFIQVHNGARVVPALGLLIALTTGCEQVPSSAVSSQEVTAPSANPRASTVSKETSVGDELGRLRAATARFHDIAAADSAGYSTRITGCMSDPTLGGMGFHYGKASAIDGTADPLEPEVLLYEPQKNGRLRLVAVEFVIPYSARPRNGPAPTLFGQSFLQNDAFELWGLHAWIWRNNPSGMFADWNPEVDCDDAAVAARMSHVGR